MSTPRSLAAENLRVTRGENTLFAGLNLSLSAGQALIVRGGNGTGKTSLLRLLAGLLVADEGNVSIDGHAVSPLDARLRDAALYMGHASGIKDDFTATENLREALLLEGCASSDEVCLQALDRVELLSRRRVLSRRLSQGQRRRILLAQLLLTTKKIWLLDEPTNALDAAGVKLFTEIVNQHLHSGGMAVMATHLPLEIADARELTIVAPEATTLKAAA